MLWAAVLLRLALVVLLVGLALVYVYGYDLGVYAVGAAPVLARYQMPLHLAGVVGALPVLAGVKAGFDVASVVERGDAVSATAVRLLRRLRVLVGVTAGYLLVCAVGMGTVLDRLDLGTPGVLLAAFVGEVVLASLMGVLTVLERRSSDELARRRHQLRVVAHRAAE